MFIACGYVTLQVYRWRSGAATVWVCALSCPVLILFQLLTLYNPLHPISWLQGVCVCTCIITSFCILSPHSRLAEKCSFSPKRNVWLSLCPHPISLFCHILSHLHWYDLCTLSITYQLLWYLDPILSGAYLIRTHLIMI